MQNVTLRAQTESESARSFDVRLIARLTLPHASLYIYIYVVRVFKVCMMGLGNTNAQSASEQLLTRNMQTLLSDVRRFGRRRTPPIYILDR